MVREEKPLEIYVSLSQQCRKTNDVTHVISFFCTVNTLQGRLMGDVLVVGAVRKRVQRKMHCSVWGGGEHWDGAGPAWEEHSRGEGVCRGTRRTEECRSYVAEEGDSTEEGGKTMSEDQRSSVSGIEAVSERRARTRSMALFSARRHSFTLRKVWTWARAGKACTEEDRDTGADRESMQGSRTCGKEKES